MVHSLLALIVLYVDDILLYYTISSNLDYLYLQSDPNAVQDWVNCNPSRCKFVADLIKSPLPGIIHGETYKTLVPQIIHGRQV